MPKIKSKKIAQNIIAFSAKTILSTPDCKQLHDFFHKQTQIGHTYFPNGSQYQLHTDTIVFKQDVLCRNINPTTKKHVIYNCDFIPNTKNKQGKFEPKIIGTGAYGTLYPIEKTIQIDQLKFMPYGYIQPRVIKAQRHCECPTEVKSSLTCKQHHPKQRAIEEYQVTIQAQHLQFQPPVFDAPSHMSYSVMNLLPGRELAHIIHDDKTKKRSLTLDERIDLTLSLMQAVQTQVIEKSLIHRDLKPENFLVDLQSVIVANVIDFGLSITLPEGQTAIMDSRRCGSTGFVALEVITSNGAFLQSSKQDVFSLGRVLLLIWGNQDKNDDKPYQLEQYKIQLREKITLPNLYLQLNAKDKRTLSLSITESIRSLLKRMLHLIPEERIELAEAISEFKTIQARWCQEKTGHIVRLPTTAPTRSSRFFTPIMNQSMGQDTPLTKLITNQN